MNLDWLYKARYGAGYFDPKDALKDEDGGVYTSDGKKLLRMSKQPKEYTVRAGVEEICDEAFAFNENLEKVSFLTSGDGKPTLNRIGKMAFLGCTALAEINIPSSLTKIGPMAFARCTKLKALVIPESVETLTRNPMAGVPTTVLSFEGDKWKVEGDTVVTADGSTLIHCLTTSDKYTVPENIKTICSEAFDLNMNLKELILPATVERAEKDSITYCPELEIVRVENLDLDCEDFVEIESCRKFRAIIVPQKSKKNFSKKMPFGKLFLIE